MFHKVIFVVEEKPQFCVAALVVKCVVKQR